MSNPQFTHLNGQVKTPLRWYTSLAELNRYRPECEDEGVNGCEYGILSSATHLPPFQFRIPADFSVVTLWEVIDMDGNVVQDITEDLQYVDHEYFEGVDYMIYEGHALVNILPFGGPYRMEMTVGGVVYYSETIKVVCPTLGASVLTNGDFADGFTDWVFDAAHFFNAVRTTNTPGDPSSTGLQVGDLVVNFGDGLVYTYTGGGAFTSAAPSGVPYFYITEEHTWFKWDGVWSGLAEDPVSIIPSGDVFLVCWSGDVPVISLTHDLTGIPPGAYELSVIFNIESLPGDLHVTGPGGVDFVSSGGSSVEFNIVIGPGVIDPLVLTPEDGWGGCIRGITLRPYATADDCFAALRWTNCGNVGNLYYEKSFINEFYLDDARVLKQKPLTVIKGETNGDDEFIPDFVKQEVEYTLHVGYVPWHIVDALSLLPLHDTIQLTLPGASSYDTLKNVRVIVGDDDDTTDQCMQLVEITFEIAEASISTGCCDVFDPPCITPCQTVLGTVDDVSPGVGWYIVPNTGQVAFNDGDTLAAPVACNGGLVIASFGPDPFLFFVDGNWLPLVQITDFINPPSCDPEHLPFNVSANIPGRYSGQGQVSLDGGATWTDVGVPYSADEWGSGVDILLPTAGDFRIRVFVNDCEIGWSAIRPFDCCYAGSLTECVYYQDFREAGSEAQTEYNVSAFFVGGVDQLAMGVLFATPLNVITVGGRPFVTNLIDALNACEVCGFSFWPTANRRPIDSSGPTDRGGYFRLRSPSGVSFEIIIKTNSDFFAYRYTDTDGSQYWDGSAWAQTFWPYQSQDPAWGGAAAPEDCTVIS